MVRVNLINPEKLADQHLIAEYNEILMLIGHVKKFPHSKDLPEEYPLGKGHIKFFKNKLLYLKKRHSEIRDEMKRRGFRTNVKINLSRLPKSLHKDWIPDKKDFALIEKRILWKIKNKPDYYRHYGKKQSLRFFKELMKKAE